MDLAKKYFGARIKELREALKLNQEQLAEIVDIEARHLSRIETGKSFTTMENIVKIAKALNVEIKDLFIFNHKKSRETLITDITNFLQNSDDKKIELVYKFISTLYK